MSGTLCKEGDSLHGQFTFCDTSNHRSLGFSGSPGVTLPYSLSVTPRKHLETPLAKCWSKQEIIGHLMSVSSFWAGSLIKARFTRLCLLPSLGLFITSQGQGEWRVRTQVEMIKAARQKHNIPSLSGEKKEKVSSLFLRNKKLKTHVLGFNRFQGHKGHQTHWTHIYACEKLQTSGYMFFSLKTTNSCIKNKIMSLNKLEKRGQVKRFSRMYYMYFSGP